MVSSSKQHGRQLTSQRSSRANPSSRLPSCRSTFRPGPRRWSMLAIHCRSCYAMAWSAQCNSRRRHPSGCSLTRCTFPNGCMLRPGDRLVLISDGIVEAKPVGGEPLGDIALHTLLRDMSDLSAVETVRQVTAAVVAHRAGDLQDDATAVCLDWRGSN